MMPLVSPRPAATLLARIRRIPFPALAAAVGLLFAVAGVAVLDDYGISGDEYAQRRIANANANYIMGDRDALPTNLNHFYGIAFELPLLMVERVLGWQDDRDIYLTRHLLTHLFFIAGGIFCGLLAYRMFGNRWAALLAMLLFLLHPRLYAHSFYNSKDIPFLVMFIIALYLTHRAFRKDTVGAFALLGVVVGLAVNMRPFALLLLPAVLAMRGLDWRFALNSPRRKNILLTGGVFAATVLAAIYVSQPHYWENPLRFIDGFQTFSQHPTLIFSPFRGQFISSHTVPPEYIPVWFGITTPPLALLLGAVGAAAVCQRGLCAPGQILRSGELRFLFLLLGCFVLPVAAVIAMQSNIYNGWRQMYFLWGPFCLLAAAAVASTAGFSWGKYMPRLMRQGISYGRVRRIVVYGLTSASLAGAVYAIVSLHPQQQSYFNLLVNRAAPDELGQQYEMSYWGTQGRQGLEYLLELYPEETLYVLERPMTDNNQKIIPAGERERIILSDGWTADFHIRSNRDRYYLETAPAPVIYERRAYGSVYLDISAPRLVWGAGLQPDDDVYRAVYQTVTAAGPPAAQGTFDVYVGDGAIYYVKENCALADTESLFSLHLFPADGSDLPAGRGEYGFDNRDFNFFWRGGFFDGKCITQEPLPDYYIARIRTGQYIAGGATLWQADVNLSDVNLSLYSRFQEIEAALRGSQPVSKGVFDLYLDENRVVYYKNNCADADTEARFFLHTFPADLNSLPVERRGYGFGNLGFAFSEYGAHQGGKCLASVALPDYAVDRIRTGQFVSGAGQIWQAEFAADE